MREGSSGRRGGETWCHVMGHAGGGISDGLSNMKSGGLWGGGGDTDADDCGSDVTDLGDW